jgi:trimethylamine--corrinoid protein Co-methyltransferase
VTALGTVVSSPAALKLRVLSAADAERLHGAALGYLAQTGVLIESTAALDLLAQAGATVDREKRVAKPAAELVERAVAQAPRSFVLAGRRPENDVVVDGRRCLLGAGGLATKVLDEVGAQARPATAADLTAACTVADYLPEVAFVMAPPVRALDVPDGARALRELELCLGATGKHVQLGTPLSPAEAAAAVAMATVVAGSPGELRRRPPLSLRGLGPCALDAALVFAAHGLPCAAVAAVPGPAPNDLSAALALMNAAVLAAATVVQLAHPGAPFFYAAQPELLGWRPLLRGPAASLFALACSQLAERYGLPLSASVMTTDAAEPGWQASAENAFAASSATLAPSDMLVGAGLLAGGAVYSHQQMVMDSEAFSWTAKIAQGIAVDDETIALETIREVGMSGNYLSARHTRDHSKDVWRPRLLDRSPWDAWVRSGKPGAYHRASELTHEILATHEVAPLEPGQTAELARIVAKVDHGKETT